MGGTCLLLTTLPDAQAATHRMLTALCSANDVEMGPSKAEASSSAPQPQHVTAREALQSIAGIALGFAVTQTVLVVDSLMIGTHKSGVPGVLLSHAARLRWCLTASCLAPGTVESAVCSL